ncbi:hypothetical protein [Nocardioides sp.]|uniref:hypothetical protein n=1 Tax=Nocardioides sp. TaxID=35761 RepID=UPI002ED34CA7
MSRPHHVAKVLEPLLALQAGDRETGRKGLRRLVRSLRKEPGDRLLVTLEDLAEVPEEPAAELLTALSEDFEVHTVLTARDWSLQIPSEWQQLVKSKLTTPYGDFVTAVRAHRPEAAPFWLRQYLPDIATRWSQGLSPGRLHVIAVPSHTRDPNGIFRLFGDLVGFDIGTLEIDRERSNMSLGYEQVETLRLVNAALGDRLADVRTEYRAVVRPLLINGALRRQEPTRRLSLPAEHFAWVDALSRVMVEELRTAGHDLLGEPEDLVPVASGAEVDLDVDADSVARVAVQALADVMVRSHQLTVARTSAPAQELAKAGSPDAAPIPSPTARSRRASALMRRVARRTKRLVTRPR